MATKDTGQGASGLSRRDFLKASAAATAVVGCGLDFAYDPAKASAYEGLPGDFQITTTTCPYCSASCGQRVVVDKRVTVDGDPNPNLGKVIDMYGDFDSPFNSGGLCSKGAGTLQLVNNQRRLGVGSSHASLPNPMSSVFDASGTDVGYYRQEAPTGDGQWHRGDLQTLMNEAAVKMVAARGVLPADNDSNKVAFFGSSHMNNEPNWMYRKLVANFGTTNTEHQARI